MKGNVVPIEPDIEVVGKTAAELVGELQAVLDDYAGNVSNAEALGALEIVKHNTLVISREDD